MSGKREINIYREKVPESFTHTFGITIHSKNSERYGIEYDLVCVLYDAVANHPQFKDVKIIDIRDNDFIKE